MVCCVGPQGPGLEVVASQAYTAEREFEAKLTWAWIISTGMMLVLYMYFFWVASMQMVCVGLIPLPGTRTTRIITFFIFCVQNPYELSLSLWESQLVRTQMLMYVYIHLCSAQTSFLPAYHCAREPFDNVLGWCCPPWCKEETIKTNIYAMVEKVWAIYNDQPAEVTPNGGLYSKGIPPKWP